MEKTVDIKLRKFVRQQKGKTAIANGHLREEKTTDTNY